MNKTSVAQQAKKANFLPPAQGVLQRQCACGNQTVAGGECAECAKKKTTLQRKLTIGASNDPLEQEADRVADQIMSASLSSAVNSTPPRIQRFSGQASKGANTAPASVDRVLASSGKPLDLALRKNMEQRFDHDFSQVRVHTGGAAEQSARDVNAQAYTVENDIVFGAGRFAPQSLYGQKLIAHELTHVIQQLGTGEIRNKLDRSIISPFVIQKKLSDFQNMPSKTNGRYIQRKEMGNEDSAETFDEEAQSEEVLGQDQSVELKKGGCTGKRELNFQLKNSVPFEFTIPKGCKAGVKFEAKWDYNGDCCTGADTYKVKVNNKITHEMPVAHNVCGAENEIKPAAKTITVGSGRQQFNVKADRLSCEGIAMSLKVTVDIS